MDRRTVITAAAALPCIAAPALALAETTDPAVTAHKAWRAAHDAYEADANANDDDTPESAALHAADWAARLALCDANATTPAGIACQIRFAFDVFGYLPIGGCIDNPEDYQFSKWVGDVESRLLRSLLAGAEGMANA